MSDEDLSHRAGRRERLLRSARALRPRGHDGGVGGGRGHRLRAPGRRAPQPGRTQVRESWRQMFAAGPHARVQITQQVAISGMMLAVHSVHENFHRRGRASGCGTASAAADRRDQRLPAHRRRLAHDRAPRLAGAGAADAPAAARRPAQDPALSIVRGTVVAARRPPADHLRRAAPAAASAPGARALGHARRRLHRRGLCRRAEGGTATLLVLFHGLEAARPTATTHAPSPRTRRARAGACVVPHFRGCSGEPNRLPRAYHSGDSGGNRLGPAQGSARRCARPAFRSAATRC